MTITLKTGEVITLNREYIQARAGWIVEFNRAGKWLVDKPRRF